MIFIYLPELGVGGMECQSSLTSWKRQIPLKRSGRNWDITNQQSLSWTIFRRLLQSRTITQDTEKRVEVGVEFRL
jgi:hypothetical protein